LNAVKTIQTLYIGRYLKIYRTSVSLESQLLTWFEINDPFDPLFLSDQIKKKEKQWARFYGNMIYILLNM
jgi:hypothetical protein